MIKLNNTFPEDFLEEEERDGYLVTRKMKEVWAIELDLLMEAMRVMDKYSIKYYALGGTLLGAVRHKGYIPWDDDIDIALPRNDYERLRKVASKEFSHPYFFQDEFNSPGLLCGHAKLRNSETTMVHSNHLNEKVGDLSFNMGIFIDFFPVDNIPDNEEERNKWVLNIKKVAARAWHLRLFTHRGRTIGNNRIKYVLQSLLLSVLRDPHLYFKKYNRLVSKYSNESTSKACLYCVYCRDDSAKKRWTWNNSDLDVNSLIDLPFEFIKIPCPSNFDAILTQSYGNWHKKLRLNSQHGSSADSFYNANISYRYYFDSKGNLDRMAVRKAMKNSIE